jgi:hypothetical protein
LAYYYIRTLIHRPAIGSTLGDKASSSVLAVADSSKHIIQIVELLDERGLSFSFCLDKPQLLILAGVGLLFPSLYRNHLNQPREINKETQRLLRVVLTMVGFAREPSGGSQEFTKIAYAFLKGIASSANLAENLVDHSSTGNSTSPKEKVSMQNKIRGLASKFSLVSASSEGTTQSSDKRGNEYSEPMFMGNLPNASRTSLSSPLEPAQYNDYHHGGRSHSHPHRNSFTAEIPEENVPVPNLDYLSFPATPKATALSPPDGIVQANNHLPSASAPAAVTQEEWARLLSSIDNGQTNIYDNIYGGLPVDDLIRQTGFSQQAQPHLSESMSGHSSSSRTGSASVTSAQHWSSESEALYDAALNGMFEDITPHSETTGTSDELMFEGESPKAHYGVLHPGTYDSRWDQGLGSEYGIGFG